ncbi:hypothetical protein Agub_g12322 [Astrephomene gubernaculifera]|uniref:Cyclic nucleotide-binding domain-containing protein n=1 Tax=Astrephomene gubernaculifera TaxID=47775 RepID=A0AAD3HRF5_9CHLO|nr:hypothetical protein Agub_g12322 [Astrephomene gubernaculifera]
MAEASALFLLSNYLETAEWKDLDNRDDDESPDESGVRERLPVARRSEAFVLGRQHSRLQPISHGPGSSIQAQLAHVKDYERHPAREVRQHFGSSRFRHSPRPRGSPAISGEPQHTGAHQPQGPDAESLPTTARPFSQPQVDALGDLTPRACRMPPLPKPPSSAKRAWQGPLRGASTSPTTSAGQTQVAMETTAAASASLQSFYLLQTGLSSESESHAPSSSPRPPSQHPQQKPSATEASNLTANRVSSLLLEKAWVTGGGGSHPGGRLQGARQPQQAASGGSPAAVRRLRRSTTSPLEEGRGSSSSGGGAGWSNSSGNGGGPRGSAAAMMPATAAARLARSSTCSGGNGAGEWEGRRERYAQRQDQQPRLPSWLLRGPTATAATANGPNAAAVAVSASASLEPPSSTSGGRDSGCDSTRYAASSYSHPLSLPNALLRPLFPASRPAAAMASQHPPQQQQRSTQEEEEKSAPFLTSICCYSRRRHQQQQGRLNAQPYGSGDPLAAPAVVDGGREGVVVGGAARTAGGGPAGVDGGAGILGAAADGSSCFGWSRWSRAQQQQEQQRGQESVDGREEGGERGGSGFGRRKTLSGQGQEVREGDPWVAKDRCGHRSRQRYERRSWCWPWTVPASSSPPSSSSGWPWSCWGLWGRRRRAGAAEEDADLRSVVDLEMWDVVDQYLPVFMPSTARMCWDALLLLLLLYTAVVVPLEVGFKAVISPALDASHLAVLVVFWGDIVVQLRTAYVDGSGEVVRDGRSLAAHYARTWLALDVVSALPWGEIMRAVLHHGGAREGVLAALARLPRLLRIMRLLRQLERSRYANALHILRLLGILLLAGHWTACAWHGLSEWLTGWTWMFEELPGPTPGSLLHQYSGAVYYAYVVVVGNDNSQVSPQNDVERLFVIVALLLGSVLSAVVVSNMALLVANHNSLANRYQARAALAADALRYVGAPEAHRVRVAEYFDFLAANDHPGPDADAVLSELPRGLVEDIKWRLYAAPLQRLPLFAGCDEPFMAALQSRLTLAAFTAGELIFSANDVGRDMFIMRRGCVLLKSHPAGDVVALLQAGDSFGETALLPDLAARRRACTAVAVQPTDVICLTARDLAAVCKDHPETGALVQERLLQYHNYMQLSGTATPSPWFWSYMDVLDLSYGADGDEGYDFEMWFEHGGDQLLLPSATTAAAADVAAALAQPTAKEVTPVAPNNVGSVSGSETGGGTAGDATLSPSVRTVAAAGMVSAATAGLSAVDAAVQPAAAGMLPPPVAASSNDGRPSEGAAAEPGSGGGLDGTVDNTLGYIPKAATIDRTDDDGDGNVGDGAADGAAAIDVCGKASRSSSASSWESFLQATGAPAGSLVPPRIPPRVPASGAVQPRVRYRIAAAAAGVGGTGAASESYAAGGGAGRTEVLGRGGQVEGVTDARVSGDGGGGRGPEGPLQSATLPAPPPPPLVPPPAPPAPLLSPPAPQQLLHAPRAAATSPAVVKPIASASTTHGTEVLRLPAAGAVMMPPLGPALPSSPQSLLRPRPPAAAVGGRHPRSGLSPFLLASASMATLESLEDAMSSAASSTARAVASGVTAASSSSPSAAAAAARTHAASVAAAAGAGRLGSPRGSRLRTVFGPGVEHEHFIPTFQTLPGQLLTATGSQAGGQPAFAPAGSLSPAASVGTSRFFVSPPSAQPAALLATEALSPIVHSVRQEVVAEPSATDATAATASAPAALSGTTATAAAVAPSGTGGAGTVGRVADVPSRGLSLRSLMSMASKLLRANGSRGGSGGGAAANSGAAASGGGAGNPAPADRGATEPSTASITSALENAFAAEFVPPSRRSFIRRHLSSISPSRVVTSTTSLRRRPTSSSETSLPFDWMAPPRPLSPPPPPQPPTYDNMAVGSASMSPLSTAPSWLIARASREPIANQRSLRRRSVAGLPPPPPPEDPVQKALQTLARVLEVDLGLETVASGSAAATATPAAAAPSSMATGPAAAAAAYTGASTRADHGSGGHVAANRQLVSRQHSKLFEHDHRHPPNHQQYPQRETQAGLSSAQHGMLLTLMDAVIRRFGVEALPAVKEAVETRVRQVEMRLTAVLQATVCNLKQIEHTVASIDDAAAVAKRRLAALEHAALEATADGVLAPRLLGLLDTDAGGITAALERLHQAAASSSSAWSDAALLSSLVNANAGAGGGGGANAMLGQQGPLAAPAAPAVAAAAAQAPLPVCYSPRSGLLRPRSLHSVSSALSEGPEGGSPVGRNNAGAMGTGSGAAAGAALSRTATGGSHGGNATGLAAANANSCGSTNYSSSLGQVRVPRSPSLVIPSQQRRHPAVMRRRTLDPNQMLAIARGNGSGGGGGGGGGGGRVSGGGGGGGGRVSGGSGGGGGGRVSGVDGGANTIPGSLNGIGRNDNIPESQGSNAANAISASTSTFAEAAAAAAGAFHRCASGFESCRRRSLQLLNHRLPRTSTAPLEVSPSPLSAAAAAPVAASAVEAGASICPSSPSLEYQATPDASPVPSMMQQVLGAASSAGTRPREPSVHLGGGAGGMGASASRPVSIHSYAAVGLVPGALHPGTGLGAPWPGVASRSAVLDDSVVRDGGAGGGGSRAPVRTLLPSERPGARRAPGATAAGSSGGGTLATSVEASSGSVLAGSGGGGGFRRLPFRRASASLLMPQRTASSTAAMTAATTATAATGLTSVNRTAAARGLGPSGGGAAAEERSGSVARVELGHGFGFED